MGRPEPVGQRGKLDQPDPIRVLAGKLPRRTKSQPGLAGAPRARQGQEPAPAQERVDVLKLALAPDERGELSRKVVGSVLGGGRPHASVGRISGQRSIVLEDALQKLPKRRLGLDSELLHQRAAGLVEHATGVRLAAAAIQRGHQLARCALAQGMLGEECLELRHHLGVVPQSEVGVQARFQRVEPEFLETGGVGSGERLEHELGERGSAPQRECVPEQRRGPLGIARKRIASLGKQPFEPDRIDDIDVDRQRVARLAGEQRSFAGGDPPMGIEPTPERGDVRLKRVQGVAGRVVPPQTVDEAVG